MTTTVYCVTDLGPGDGGKGGVVHFLAKHFHAQTVVKEGGAQGSHGVITSKGESFNFSQWGCGTLEGVPTYLSERFVVSPTGLLAEAEALERLGINDPFQLLSASPFCVTASPFHQAWSRLDELKRRENPRGTVGTGVGKAYRDSKLDTNRTICLEDLKYRAGCDIRRRLKDVRDYIKGLYADCRLEDFLVEDRELAERELKLLRDEDDLVLDDATTKYVEVGRRLKLQSLSEVLSKDGVVVVERSHGVLTDSVMGFAPHVSALRTLPKFSVEMFRRAGYTGEIKHIGVHRAYEVRHGAGPMPTARKDWDKNVPGSHKDANRWQGEVRFGPLDTVLLQYALWACRDTPMDCLALTWFDQVLKTGIWEIAHKYYDCRGKPLIRTYNPENGSIWMDYKALTNLPEVFKKQTRFEKIEVPLNGCVLEREPEKCIELASDMLSVFIDVPVRLISLGPTELDKYII